MDIKDNLDGKALAKDYYNQEAQDYANMYNTGYKEYPSNLIRLNMLIRRFKQLNIISILDAGCGTCLPMARLSKEGFKVKGFDFSEEMITEGKQLLKENNLPEDLIYKADLEDESSLNLNEKFDAIIALGVFPHIVHEEKALSNMKKLLNSEGRVFIEFRNDLFSVFTLNKYSADFFLNKVIKSQNMPEDLKNDLISFYSDKFNVEKPKIKEDGKISYQEILAKFKNPLTIEKELFEPIGFKIEKMHFYHFHALPPIFEERYPELFRKLSLEMENPDDWRGYLMSSAFVVEAVKND